MAASIPPAPSGPGPIADSRAVPLGVPVLPDGVATGTMTRVLNVAWWQGAPEARLLSNFAPRPFVLDGERYGSVESFWQALKFPEGSPERRAVAALAEGFAAKQAGKKAPKRVTLTYQGQTVRVGGPAHHRLAERAIRAKVATHADVRECLEATADARLTHVLMDKRGQPLPDSPALPSAVLCDILTRIRAELAAGTFSPDIPVVEDPSAAEAASATTTADVGEQLGLF